MIIQSDRDERYREILIAPVRTCADFKPMMGQKEPVDLNGFTSLYGSDPFYHWIGLDDPKMFAVHKASGGMTSVYRQVGIGGERLVREVLQDSLGLNSEDVKWGYNVPVLGEDGNPLLNKAGEVKTRRLDLDGRIPLDKVSDGATQERVKAWVEKRKTAHGITVPLNGAVFEVRQGYKSADSKRQNGDLTNATHAIGKGYLPVLMVLSEQMNFSVQTRYRASNWTVLMGDLTDDTDTSTFAFFHDVVGYDLQAFFERQTEAIRSEVAGILSGLLATE
ncbi:MAG: hypothetical protein L0I10_09950 [Bifidobacterium crudilactis]|uniref:hypothetical protein n=1 Tax=Bifidobacterium crudilactis TaxID=327277 RepID=UPI0026482134|nr:hypothetical protein [Bifidobacterium crudilactis]MDN5973370.1 hypothetical protein [Bifidobacterium crudilactis]MDN6523366.1 hypothetical protein [Bifidobacterium crudilactis]